MPSLALPDLTIPRHTAAIARQSLPHRALAQQTSPLQGGAALTTFKYCFVHAIPHRARTCLSFAGRTVCLALLAGACHSEANQTTPLPYLPAPWRTLALHA